jgi:hypothetical protein
MMNTHSQRLERWLGTEQVENLSQKMRGWYGPPVPIANIPGRVYACGDGDFCGSIKGGYYANLLDYTMHKVNKGLKKIGRNSFNAGFASLSDLISEATTGGKRQSFMISKTGAAGVVNIANTLWDVGSFPPAGSTSAAAAGSSPTNETTGAIPYNNPTGGDILHFISATFLSTVANNCLLMYDRFFQVNHVMTVDPQSVSGVPTRYQDSTAAGTFITVNVSTVLAASTPTYTITYVDQDGNTAENTSAQTIVSGAIARRFPFASSVGNGWYFPLNSGDTGVRSITNLNLSAAMASGAVDVVLGKPYVLIPCPVANMPIIVDGINSAFNLVKITDSSCLSFLELNKGSGTAANYIGMLVFCSG